jgi:hypothetical protein
MSVSLIRSSTKKKFALASWKWVCMSKQLGGLEVMDLHIMNISLLLKWWWKLENPQYNSLWKQIVSVKYSKNTYNSIMSSIWKDVGALNQLGQTGRAVVLGDGQNANFLHDRWYGECALLSHFHHLFSLCQQLHISVSEVVRSGG